MTDNARESAIRRARALLAVTLDSGASDAEANAARVKLAEHLKQHQITLEELNGAAPPPPPRPRRRVWLSAGVVLGAGATVAAIALMVHFIDASQSKPPAVYGVRAVRATGEAPAAAPAPALPAPAVAAPVLDPATPPQAVAAPAPLTPPRRDQPLLRPEPAPERIVIAAAEAPAAEAPAADGALQGARVVIAHSAEDLARARAIAERLAAEGAAPVELRRVVFGVGESHVRYFAPEDALNAARVAALASDDGGRDVTARDLSGLIAARQDRPIELRLGP